MKKHDKNDEIQEAIDKEKGEEKQEQVDEKDKKIEELTNLLRSTQADFINYRNRVEKEKQESAYYYKKEIITHLLPTLDMFELALKHTSNHEDFVKGMDMIFAQFINSLENEGLQIIPSEDKFNPRLHEVILTEDSDKEDGTILEEMQKGYMLNDKVIRYSRVKVSKKNE